MTTALRPRGRVAGVGALLVALSAGGLTVVSAGTASAATQHTFYASPEVSDGSGRSCESVAAACSLTDARDKVRTKTAAMTGDIVVNLLGGTYSLSSTFTLSAASQDSGTNGHNVIYQNYRTDIPVLSGGRKITGWTQFDSTKGIWSAPAPAGVDSRQLYVNGIRQTRARGNTMGSWTKTATGWSITDGAFQNYKNVSGVEIVNNHAWMQLRCPVASATATTVTMAQPCWKNANQNVAVFQGVTRIENAYELLDATGEWYLDRTGAVAGNSSPRVYFKPADGATLSTDKVVLPTLETLLSATGTSANKLRKVQFKGIRFENATWTRPNGTEGYPVCQSGYLYYGTNTGKDSEELFRTPGNVDVQQAADIRFEGNTFTRLGAVGLSVMKGTQDITVVGNRFEDISSSAISIGHINDHHPATADIVKNVSVTDNYVVRAGAEYEDAVAMLAAYPQNLNLSHNEISNVPYTGISVGWGWGRNDVGGSNGYTTPTPLKDNTINNNHVHDYMKVLLDGGGIYTHSNQPGTVVKYNHLRNSTGDTGLYPDEGTQNIAWEHNVVAEMGGGNWVQMYGKISNTTARYNFTDSTKSVNQGTNNIISDNQTGLTSWPAEAQTIMANAGVRAAYRGGGGTVVSQGKPTTASSVQHTGVEAEKATDGNPYNRWSSAFSDPQWLQVDLGQTHYINRVNLNWENAFARSYQIQTSPDATTWSPIYSTTTGDGGTDDLTVNGTGRYIRMYGTQRGTQFGYSLYEMSVYGSTTPPVTVKDTNLALNGKLTTSSTWPHATYDPSFAIDGRVRDDAGYGNRWLANGSLFPSTLTLDLGAAYKLSRIKHTSSEIDGSTWKYKLEGSTNGSSWTTLADHTVDAVADGTTDVVTGTHRYVRLTLTWAANFHWPSSNEFEVYGTNSTDPN